MGFWNIFEFISVSINILLVVSASIIANHLLKLYYAYEKQRHVEKVDRTIKALQLPKNISTSISKLFFEHRIQEKDDFFDNPFYENEIFEVLDFFENLATGIHEEIYDERISYNRLGRTLLRFYALAAIPLYRSRGEGLSLSLYVELERLVRSWKGRSPDFPMGEL